MIRVKLLLLICITLILVSGCYDGAEYRHQIFDNYYIYSDDGEEYYLTCKLSCENDPSISNVTNIKWNKKSMFITVGLTNSERYYVVIAKGDKLKCCNDDLLIEASKITFDSLSLIFQTKDDNIWDNLP